MPCARRDSTALSRNKRFCCWRPGAQPAPGRKRLTDITSSRQPLLPAPPQDQIGRDNVLIPARCPYLSFLFFTDTATTEIYPLSLHDALPIWRSTSARPQAAYGHHFFAAAVAASSTARSDRKRQRLNSSTVPLSLFPFFY